MNKQELLSKYAIIREKTEQICQPLLTEDYVIQSMTDVSPPKWHLAHTTWFFETFLLVPYLKGYRPFHPQFRMLFNSYYNDVGKQHPREQRGLLSRPSVKTIYDYRLRVNEMLSDFIMNCGSTELATLSPIVFLGLQHEQQHQELLLMDIKHNFYIDPSFPAYQSTKSKVTSNNCRGLSFSDVEAGTIEIGYAGAAFCFDNELPCHKYYLKSYAIANRLITNGEYLEFILCGGYQNPSYWLADGWDIVTKNKWNHPLYWQYIDGHWYIFTLSGLQTLEPDEPVSHVSYYEADAFARWSGKRLPSEPEWEHFVMSQDLKITPGNFLDQLFMHPRPSSQEAENQFFGDLWEWTATPYGPYPGFKPFEVFGEYNGKFMNNQMVLRGGSCITPKDHIRATYRNFFQPEKRWQFSGIRLAYDLE